MAGSTVIDDPHYTTLLYHKAEAAHIIAVPAQTFRNWAVGYARKRLDGSQLVSAPIVTTLEPARPQGVSVPFVGLAKAYIVAAFTKAGVFLDRGLGAFVVPRALRAAGWTLETMGERYGAGRSQSIQDAQWIEEATLAGDVLLCMDLPIAQNPLEAQAVYMTSAGAFAPCDGGR